MTLPYYAEDISKLPTHHLQALITLVLPDVISKIGHITQRKIGLLPPPQLFNIINGYMYAENAKYYLSNGINIFTGVEIYVKTIEIYLEIINLVAALNKYDEMQNIYTLSMNYVVEGQHELFNCNKQIDSLENTNTGILFSALLSKYHTLHEFIIRYSITMAVYCLDNIANHNDVSRKSVEEYCMDDLSYKVNKIKTCLGYNFIHKLEYLLKGIEPQIRNSYSHKTFSYDDNNNVIFHDHNKKTGIDWKKKYTLTEFENLIETIELNMWAQIAALTIFTYEYEDKLSFEKTEEFKDLKQLRDRIFQYITDSYFIAKNIIFENKTNEIICDIEKTMGFDNPTESFANIGGVIIKQRMPAFNVEEQTMRIMHLISQFKIKFNYCRINVYDYKGEQIGSIKIDLKLWNELIERGASKEEFENNIMENTLKI